MTMKRLLPFLFFVLLCVFSAQAIDYQKREMRGAWIQCVNGQYLGKTPAQIRQLLSQQLDVLAAAHINTIFFQVRAECDALYKSNYEPWSRFLTGQQGARFAEDWDPLAWMVEACHRRNMECHAWINPYRAKTKGTSELASNHVAKRYPRRVFKYGDLLILNPALEENRLYTCMIVEDILQRYDVDGIHIDDYFYPYPRGGENIPDAADYQRNPRGFKTIGDWRRDNVNLLIQDLHRMVRTTKPWARFGVSPFGIYHNSADGRNDKSGSATKGLQNYDDLYADVLLWVEKGWVDYLIPQIYWNIGTQVADYSVLCQWWDTYASDRPLVIGQDVERTVSGTRNQVREKYDLLASLSHVSGTCQWYAASFVENPGNYRYWLTSTYYRYPALQVSMPFISKKKPGKPRQAKVELRGGKAVLSWEAPEAKSELTEAVSYVVYQFPKGKKIDLDDPRRILAITRERAIELPSGLGGSTLVITSLNRLQNESKGVKIKL